MSQEIEQIKERLSVLELVGEYVKLEKSGIANHRALCPFHNEKTPSFMVNTERNFWYCFGCQKGGDVFSFLQDIEGLEFREALERLAERTGVELPRFFPTDPQLKGHKSKKQKILEILQLTSKLYQHQLFNSQKGKECLDYLKDRGISGELIKEFQIGYAPNAWRVTFDFLTKRKYALDDILASGLLVSNEGKQYDRFRGRITFPIIDVNGKTLGFSARVAPGGDESSAKYINTSQTLVYDKSKVLYGLYQARGEIRNKNTAIIVEGNVDVIASHQAGIKNVVAISGTALTPDHAKLIKRYTEKIKLCFDMDQAGQKATEKSVRTCLAADCEVEIITLPDNLKDAGDAVEKGSEVWQEAIEKSQNVMDYLFTKVFAKYDQDNIQDKKKIARDLLNIIKDIADPIEQNYYLKKLANRLAVEEGLLASVLDKAKVKSDKFEQNQQQFDTPKESAPPKPKTRAQALEEQILGLFFLFFDQLQSIIGESKIEEILKEDNLALWQRLAAGQTREDESRLNELSMRVKYSYDSVRGAVENEIEPLKEWNKTLKELKQLRKREKLQQLELSLKQAEEMGNEEEAERITNEIMKNV